MAGKRKASGTSQAAGFPPWSRAKLAPVVLLSGKQRVFSSRALAALKQQAREQAQSLGALDPPEAILVDAQAYQSGVLAQNLSPSLFGGMPLVLVEQLEAANADLLADLASYLSAGPSEEAHLILVHAGGNHGKKILDLCRTLAKTGACGIFQCEDPKNDVEKMKFLEREATARKRGLEPGAAKALVNALGEEFEELVAVADQLLDTAGDPLQPLTLDDVQVYLGGRVEASGFDVADAATAGDVGLALSRLRHALNIGVEPVLVVTAMASKIRQMLQVSGDIPAAVRETGLLGDADLPKGWIATRARQNLSRWDDRRLGLALKAVSAADAQVKGAGRDRDYALEAMVLQVCRYASGASGRIASSTRGSRR